MYRLEWMSRYQKGIRLLCPDEGAGMLESDLEGGCTEI